ncbi:MAG: nuclear transport factor 2 family protein [Caulobacteraceae bacterium]
MSKSPDFEPLPPFVDAYFRATNAGDLVGLVATFEQDALVNDQLRDIWGVSAITDWARQDIVGLGLRLKPVSWLVHYDAIIVTAHAEGPFDRRGLPDPLVLSLHFSGRDGKIDRLIILQNVT